MDYKKDKRTKNLTLRDIHIGDWVQVWSETTERYSPPLKIISICDDGTICLVASDMDYLYYILPKTSKIEWKGVEK